jgi:PadR family transcriptional regulator, regulatory protein AphA
MLEAPMSLDHAILGFLHYKPLSGYDLKSVFDASVRHFWAADQSQIYRTLSRLADRGWTEIEIIEQDDRPDRKVYHITDQGREELTKWLKSSLQHKPEHIAELVQVFFAGHLDEADAVGMFRKLAERTRRALDELRRVPEESKESTDYASSRDKFFWMLTLDYGIRITEANLSWLENAIARLEQGEHTRGERNEHSGF